MLAIEIDDFPIKDGGSFHSYINMVELISNIPSGYDIHSSPWFFDGPNRNRWAVPFFF